MAIDFNQIFDRTQHHSMKWNRYRGRDVLPVWVADADFRCAQPLLDAVQSWVDHGVLGYVFPDQFTPGKEAIAQWASKRYHWPVDPDWILWMPGVVPAFNIACRAFCEPSERVLVQTPNYPPILKAPSIHQLDSCLIPTVKQGERWVLDREQLLNLAQQQKPSLFILCNPMNPCGSVLTSEELRFIADVCEKHDIVLCSDEIHGDLILEPGVSHIPAASLPELKDRSLTLMSAAKTFNIPGLSAAFVIIPNPKLRARFQAACNGIVPWVNSVGMVATAAAFTECHSWYEALINYLRENRDYLYSAINKIPGLAMIKPEATYLAWVDASGLGVADVQSAFERAGVGTSPGKDFGSPEFARINFACPRSTLEDVVSRLEQAFGNR